MPFLCEKSGCWSPEKIAAFAGAVAPALWLVWRIIDADLGARPITELIHCTGDWTVRFILISLAVSPARRLFCAPKLINMRRTLGVAAFAYAGAHLGLYILDQKYNLAKVASEIMLRFYLTIGFTALIRLITLGATSTDGMVRRLGARWNMLHQGVYVIAVLAIVHFLLQTKLDISESIMMAGLLVWLLGYRLAQRITGNVALPLLIALAMTSAAATAAGEAAWYRFGTGVDAWRVLAVNFDPSMWPRPAIWVLAAGLAVTAATWLWSSLRDQRPIARRTSSRALSGAAQVQSAS